MTADPDTILQNGDGSKAAVQPDLLDFDGFTYEREPDQVRLNEQALRVARLMADGRWRTLGEIERDTQDPQASISARLRDFRKDRFGASTVERRRRGEEARGLHEYRLEMSRATRAALVTDRQP